MLEFGAERWAQDAADGAVLDDAPALIPDRNDEYLLYQALLGAWPFAETARAGLALGPILAAERPKQILGVSRRIRQYINKAVKEAKVHGSWINADAAHDASVEAFVDALLRLTRATALLRHSHLLQRPWRPLD